MHNEEPETRSPAPSPVPISEHEAAILAAQRRRKLALTAHEVLRQQRDRACEAARLAFEDLNAASLALHALIFPPA